MKGIMFSDELIPMVLDGSKMMTRRIMKVQPDEDGLAQIRGEPRWFDTSDKTYKPRYNVGETAYLKEAWRVTHYWDDVKISDMIGDCLINYRVAESFGDNDCSLSGKWRNKLFMPEWASRCKIEITGVGAERLQDISERDAVREGCRPHGPGLCTENPDDYIGCYSAMMAFATLIDRINGPGTWDANPWCWVYSFRRMT